MSIGEQGKRATFRELWRQFRFPLIVAVVWTTLRGWEAMPINSYPAFLATVVAQFGSAFFLLSWAWGQYNRVDRQQDTTARLTAIQHNLEEAGKAIAGSLEMQKRQAAVFEKLETLAPTDPAFLATFREASRLAVESSALSVQANTGTLAAVHAALVPSPSMMGQQWANHIYRPDPSTTIQIPGWPPSPAVTLPSAADTNSDGSKSER
jgi:hypothetical protein